MDKIVDQNEVTNKNNYNLVGNDDGYYSYKVGNYAVFTAQWIESTKFYLFSEEDLGY